MAAPSEIKNGDIIEFCTELPDLESKRSPPFCFMNVEWILNFFVTNRDYEYLASLSKNYINKNVSVSPFKRFKFDFRVAVMDRENFTILHEGIIHVPPNGCEFWRIKRTELKSKLPPDYDRRGNIIKISFSFILPSEPVLQFKSRLQDKGVQTGPGLNADEYMESLSKDFSKLLDTGFNHDTKIKCGKHSIKAHKIVLCARSDVFKAMLESDMQEGRTGIVEIHDIDVSHFQDFVKYLYTDALPELSYVKAKALYEAGDMYGVGSLMFRCSEYLKDNLCLENVFECFALADAHSDQKLRDQIISYILNEKVYLKDEHWLPFCDKYPKAALQVYKMSPKNVN